MKLTPKGAKEEGFSSTSVFTGGGVLEAASFEPAYPPWSFGERFFFTLARGQADKKPRLRAGRRDCCDYLRL